MKKENNNITIVVTAYNRIDSLKRLLNSLLVANYFEDQVRLVISIDNGDNKHILKYAKEFRWPFGEKIVHYQDYNLGLREHIIKCGDLSIIYNNIILLEDDLVVSPAFYNYAKQALEFYKSDDNIGGISLYTQQFCETSKLPFKPLKNEFDIYYMQLPSSWGQLWTKSQWEGFRGWYTDKDKAVLDTISEIPQNIKQWPESSWKKYYTWYLIDQNKYFIYPYESFTTNFGDIGVHFRIKSSVFQVPLSNEINKSFNFAKLNDDIVIYDAFCENAYFSYGEYDKVCMDIYGLKPKDQYFKYTISSNKLDYEVLSSFDMCVYPPENNIKMNIKGNKLHLYNTEKVVKRTEKKQNGSLLEYFYPQISLKIAISILRFKIKQLITSYVKKDN